MILLDFGLVLEKEVMQVADEKEARQQAAKKLEEDLKADIACQKLEESKAKMYEKAEENARANEEKQQVHKETVLITPPPIPTGLQDSSRNPGIQ
jgi:hypothetical protein